MRGCLLRWGLLTGLLLGLVSGCGGGAGGVGKSFPLEGAVRWQDNKDAGELDGCTLEFESGGNVAGKANIISDGTFTLSQAIPGGDYRVRIVPGPNAKASALDPKYQKFETSNLKATVGSGANSFVEFKLTKRGA